MSKQTTIYVWDPIIRIGHWILVLAFLTAYFTEDDFLNLHVWAGYVIACVVAFRLFWGFVGSRHARFKDFIYSPKAIIGYLSNLLKGIPQHYIGHNPAGGAMVIALLLSLVGTTFSGMALYAVEEQSGPLSNIVHQINIPEQQSYQSHLQTSHQNKEGYGGTGSNSQNTQELVYTEDKLHKEQESFWEETHELFVNLTLLLVLVHIGGVVLSSYIDKEKLIKAMITGKKEHTD